MSVIEYSDAIRQELDGTFQEVSGSFNVRREIIAGAPRLLLHHSGSVHVLASAGSILWLRPEYRVDGGDWTDSGWGAGGVRLTFPVGYDEPVPLQCNRPAFPDALDPGTVIDTRIMAKGSGSVILCDSFLIPQDEAGKVWSQAYSFTWAEGEDESPAAISFWTDGTPASANIWAGACNHNDLVIAVARSGTDDRVMTTADGLAWATRASAGDYNWRRVASSGSIAVAIATGGEVMTSPTGQTWTRETMPREAGLNDICYTGLAFIAVSGNQGFAEQVYRSINGINDWSLIDQGNLGIWFTTASDGAGKVVSLSTAGEVIYSSDHGATWLTGSIDNYSWQAVEHDGQQFIAVADDGYIATSATGEVWVTKPAQVSLVNCEHIYHAYGQTIIVSSDKSGNDCAVSVDNGDNWTYPTTPTGAFWNCLASVDDKFVCVGNIGVMTAPVA